MSLRVFRRDWVFWLPFLALFADFLLPVVLLQKSFIASDFSVQHWPWARYLYEDLRAGRFPFWTNAIACGFPLAAEGQIAAFYAPHRLLYAMLPFWPAYSWSIALHFLAGAFGFYAYARQLRLSRASAGFSMLIYAFGSAFAGCYYNTGSLRTLAWFPFLLWSTEKMLLDSPRRRIARGALAALAVSQMWNAGFAQIAVYALGYGFCAALPNLRRRGGAATLFAYGAAVLLGTLIAAPQIALTWELIGSSVRQGESIAFALWGSMPPTGLISLLFPEWGNIQRISLYAGVPAVFMGFAFMVLPRARKDWRHAGLFLFFLLLALGKFNPFYAALVKGLSLTFLRNPGKFLFFAAAAFAVVAGQGLDAFLLALRRGRAGRLVGPAAVLAVSAAALPGVCRILWAHSRPAWQAFSTRVVLSVLAEKGPAAKPAAEYEAFMSGFYDRLGALFSYAQPHTLASVLLAAGCAALIFAAARRRVSRGIFLTLFFLLAAADFHPYGWSLGTGFIGNVDRISATKPSAEIAFLQKAAAEDPGSYAEFVRDPAREFLPPNRNMAYGLSHAGGYSPLLLKDYYDLTHALGIVDGSLGRAPYSEEAWKKSRGLLDLIGVKFLAADAPIDWNGFDSVGRTEKAYFYRNRTALPDAAAWSRVQALPDRRERLEFLQSEGFDPRAALVVEEDPGLEAEEGRPPVFSIAEIQSRSPTQLRALYALPCPGVGWARIAAYPGWKLRIDGKPAPWFRAGHAFIGFRLEPGSHLVELSYAPTAYRKVLERMRVKAA